MSFGILWTPQALVGLYRVHWRTGAALDAAVMQFAASVPHRAGPELSRYRVRAAGHDAVLIVDRGVEVVRVLGVYRAR